MTNRIYRSRERTVKRKQARTLFLIYPNSTTDMPKTLTNRKRHSCDFQNCDKAFASPAHLVVHKRSLTPAGIAKGTLEI